MFGIFLTRRVDKETNQIGGKLPANIGGFQFGGAVAGAPAPGAGGGSQADLAFGGGGSQADLGGGGFGSQANLGGGGFGSQASLGGY